jgi:cytochrome P450
MGTDVRTEEVLYDPAAPDFAARSHEIYRTLRDEHPIYEDPRGRFFALSRFEDVRSATLDWETYSSTGKLEALYAKPTMSSFDPPRHTQLRALIARGFTPRRVNDLEADIRRIARGLVDTFAETGECDAIAEYAAVLPSMVIGKLIGLPDDLVTVCRELTDRFMRHTSPEDGRQYPWLSYEIFSDLYDQRRRDPEDDLLTALLNAEIDGVKLTEDELLAFGWLLLVGGNDTTTNLIGNGLELFVRHPDQRRALVEDPSRLPDAVDEVLRFASPTHALARTAARDIENEYGSIPKSARVLLLWSAANLDEREFLEPERFDIARRAPRHLALGHGVHYCLGASLAKLEARIAWEEFLSRIPTYEMAQPPAHFVSSTFYGWETLHLAFEPGHTPTASRV